jgi:hypothetical protein
VVQHQLLLWIGATAAIYLLFRFIEKGVLKPETAGPSATLIIALTIYMAGITFDWRLIVISLVLSAMAVGAVYLERIMLVVAGLAVILAIAYLLLRPVIRNCRAPQISEKEPATASGEAPSNPA